MPRQVLDSHKALDGAVSLRAQRERENRVTGDSAAFGILLGTMRALQDGGAGIVRGEARDDSAAEWNASKAHDARQDPRHQSARTAPPAQQSLDRQPHESQPHAQDNPVPSASGEAKNASAKAPARSADQSKVISPVAAENPVGHQSQEPVGKAPMQGAAAFRQALAPGVGVAASASSAPASSSHNQAMSTIDATRGPRGGVARGKPLAQGPNHPERAQRFERAFQAQLGRGLAQALRSGDGTVTLRLKPQSLGQLTVRVEVEGQQVRATFEARTVEARQLLEGSREVLRQQLETRGLHADRIEVKLAADPTQIGTRLASAFDGGAEDGQDGRAFADSPGGQGRPDEGGASHRAWRGSPREEDEPAARAEPWRALGTLGLDAIA